MLKQERTARFIECEIAIRQSAPIRQRELQGFTRRKREFDAVATSFNRHPHCSARCTKQYVHLLSPMQRPLGRIRLRKDESRFFNTRPYRWAPGLFDPCMTPSIEVEFCTVIQNLDQVQPCRIAKLKLFEVGAEAVLELLRTKDSLQLAHYDRGFLVDDGAIEAARLVQVCQ